MTSSGLHQAILRDNFALALDLLSREDGLSLAKERDEDEESCALHLILRKMVDDHSWADKQELEGLQKYREKVVERLVELYPSCLVLKDNSGNLPIHYASRNNEISVKTLALLIRLFPKSLEYEGWLGMLPIHCACSRDVDPAKVKLLVANYPAGLKVKDGVGNLPVHYAATHGGTEGRHPWDIMKIILEKSPCALRVRNKAGLLPFLCAVSEGHPKMVRFFVDHYQNVGNTVDAAGNSPVHLANCTESLLLLLSKIRGGAFMTNNAGELPIHQAVREGDYERTEILLSKYPSCLGHRNKNGDLPIHLCRKNDRMFELLVKTYPGSLTESKEGFPLFVLLRYLVQSRYISKDRAIFLEEVFKVAGNRQWHENPRQFEPEPLLNPPRMAASAVQKNPPSDAKHHHQEGYYGQLQESQAQPPTNQAYVAYQPIAPAPPRQDAKGYAQYPHQALAPVAPPLLPPRKAASAVQKAKAVCDGPLQVLNSSEVLWQNAMNDLLKTSMQLRAELKEKDAEMKKDKEKLLQVLAERNRLARQHNAPGFKEHLDELDRAVAENDRLRQLLKYQGGGWKADKDKLIMEKEQLLHQLERQNHLTRKNQDMLMALIEEKAGLQMQIERLQASPANNEYRDKLLKQQEAVWKEERHQLTQHHADKNDARHQLKRLVGDIEQLMPHFRCTEEHPELKLENDELTQKRMLLQGNKADKSIGTPLLVDVETPVAEAPKWSGGGVEAAASPISKSSPKVKRNKGLWLPEEHQLFLKGMKKHGPGQLGKWKKIADMIQTRNSSQVRSHYDQYCLAKKRKEVLFGVGLGRSSLSASTTAYTVQQLDNGLIGLEASMKCGDDSKTQEEAASSRGEDESMSSNNSSSEPPSKRRRVVDREHDRLREREHQDVQDQELQAVLNSRELLEEQGQLYI